MRKIAIQSVLGALLIGMVTSALAAQGAYAMAVVPVSGTTPTLISVTINNNTGDQFDPHVSGDFAAYTSDWGSSDAAASWGHLVTLILIDTRRMARCAHKKAAQATENLVVAFYSTTLSRVTPFV